MCTWTWERKGELDSCGNKAGRCRLRKRVEVAGLEFRSAQNNQATSFMAINLNAKGKEGKRTWCLVSGEGELRRWRA